MPRDAPKERKESLSDIPMLFIMELAFQWLSTLLMGILGPKFLYAISNTISTPLGSIVSDVKMDNFEDGEIPQVLRYKIYRNSFISLTKSPLMERFPIGGKVTVYYDPKKPKHSYVERPLKPGRYAWLTKCLAYFLVFLMVALAFFIVFILPNLIK